MCRQKALLQCLTYRPSFTGSRVIAKIVPTCRFVWLLRSLKSFEQIIWRTIKLSLHGKTCRKKGGKRCSLKKILHQTIFFSAHEIAQPCRYTTSEAFQVGKGVCDIYAVLNLECYKRARKRFISLCKLSGDTGHLRGKTGGKTFQPMLYMQFDPWFVSRKTKLLKNFLSFLSQNDVWNCFSVMVSTSRNCTVSSYADLPEIKQKSSVFVIT